MAATLDPTVGGIAANTYASLAEAQAYCDARLSVEAWTGAVSDVRTRALISATARIEQEDFVGARESDTQALSFPRSGVDVDGIAIDDHVVPERVKRAQLELALVLLNSDGDFLADSGLEGFNEVKVGPLSVVPNHRQAAALPATVRRLLRPFLTSPSSSGVTLVRG